MKIIKKNKNHLLVECKHCGSILEPKEKDFEECTSKTQDPFCTIIRNDKIYILTKEETVRWVFVRFVDIALRQIEKLQNHMSHFRKENI